MYVSNFEDDSNTDPQIQFNWGYHDAVDDVTNRPKVAIRRASRLDDHFDQWYAIGYQAGYNDTSKGLDTQSSERAWNEYNA